MEEDLAKLADLVIVIVESPGTFTELGAFSISPPLRKKMLPIVHERYRHETSFIANGPLKWIDAESDFTPTIYIDLQRILLAADQVQERIQRIPKPHTTRIEDLATSPKHLLFFICDLITVIYPATMALIVSYLEEISPNILSNGVHVPTLVGLAIAMNLLRQMSLTSRGSIETYFMPAGEIDASRPFHHSRFLYLENQRAAYTSVLLTIPEARALMAAVAAGA